MDSLSLPVNNNTIPSPLDLTSKTLYDDFKTWKSAVRQYLAISGYMVKPKKQQTNFIRSIAGQQVAKASADFRYASTENKDDPAIFLRKLEELCKPLSYSMIERCTFDSIN